MSQQCHFQTSVCYMHYIKRDIFVFKVNLHSFKKEKSKKKMQKRHKTWLICSLLMYKRYTNTFSFSTTIPFYVFFYVTKYTLVYNVFPRKMFKMCFYSSRLFNPFSNKHSSYKKVNN